VLVGGKMAEELREGSPLGFPVELPTDVVAASAFEEDAETQLVPYDALPGGWLGLDIGPETRERFATAIGSAHTIFWNGPMGVFEWPRFAAGTKAVAEAVAAAEAFSVVGGADSIRALNELGLLGPGLLGLHWGRCRPRAARGERVTRSRHHSRHMKLIAGNWKMFKGPRETREFCAAFTPPAGVDAVLCPPFVSLAGRGRERPHVFAQNVHWADDGAFTGEISAPMLLELGVSGAIVGPLRAPTVFRRNGRDGGPPNRGSARHGLRVIACVGRVA
jgi:hypothetical protein